MNKILEIKRQLETIDIQLRHKIILREYFYNRVEHYSYELLNTDFRNLELLFEWYTIQIPIAIKNLQYYIEEILELEEEKRNLNLELTGIILSESEDFNIRF